MFFTKKFKNKSYFVVSTGRTGTLFLKKYIEHVTKDISSFHEPSPDLFEETINKYRFKHSPNVLKKNIYSKRKSIITDKIYLESNPFISFLIPEIKKNFPNSKFIFITREPFDYIKSIYNKKNEYEGKVYYPYDESDLRDRLKPSDFIDDPWEKKWNFFNRYEKLAWYWQKTNNIILKELKSLSSKEFIQIKFENLFNISNDIKQNEFQKICKFLEIPYEQKHLKISDKKINKSNSSIFEEGAIKLIEKSILVTIEDLKKELNY